MYNVLIVDDDKEIREGLRTKFPWAELGVTQVNTADDGETALESAEKLNPDLIVTDIKMSRMSGLEFIQSLYASEKFSGKSIVISGYDDFDLVKQAMKLGAMDYVLKPINTVELTEIIKKALDHIRRERIDKQNQILLENQIQYSLPKIQEEVLREITENEYNLYWETRMNHRLKNLQLEWIIQAKLALMIIEVDNLKAIEQGKEYRREKELVLFAIGNVVKQTLEEEYSQPFTLYFDIKDRCVVIFYCDCKEQLDVGKETAQISILRINEYVKVNVSIGLCSTLGGVKQLFKMYSEAGDILEQKAVYGGNRLLLYGELGVDTKPSEVSLSDLDEVMDLIKFGSEDEIHEMMNTLTKMVKSWSLPHIKDIHQRLFGWLLELFRKASAAGWKDHSWENNPFVIWEQLEQYDTLESLSIQIEVFIVGMSKDIKRQSVPQSQIISEAKKYMILNYAKNLTLISVASEVHVTPVWLSKLFKKDNQQTFLEYLTEIRMKKAREMLGDIRYKIYQISHDVGYRDPTHFSKVFKKSVGHSPKEFRNLRGFPDE